VAADDRRTCDLGNGVTRGTDIHRRVFDVVLATLLFLAVLPVLVIATIGTAIALRSWPFFTQRRVGRDGEEFTFIKLRTLPRAVPRYADKYQLTDYEVPGFTRALRRLHLDELPQLLLVLTGKMSLVGPRPEMPHLHDELDTVFARDRTSVRPGCTGLWQVSTFCHEMIFEHPEFDEYYLRNRSLRLDVWILARTVRLLLPVRDRHLLALDAVPGFERTPAVSVGGVADLAATSLEVSEAA